MLSNSGAFYEHHLREVVVAKIIDYFIRLLTVASFFAYFFAPASIAWSLTLLVFFAVGIWAVLFPQGIIL